MQRCFGPFRLDLDHGYLWQGEHRLALRPKTFAMLVYLVEHPGELVTKQALLRAIWPGTTVTDGVLTTGMGELRKALGETAKQPHSTSPPSTDAATALSRLSLPWTAQSHPLRHKDRSTPLAPSLAFPPGS